MPPSSDSFAISYQQSLSFLRNLCSHQEFRIELISGRSRCFISNDLDEKILEFQFPLCFPNYQTGQNLHDYTPIPVPYIILLIRAGQSALGFFDRGKIVEHKVIRKYMVRKKQGKAQLKFQKHKKSFGPGARIRMINSISFFEEINLKLQDWFKSNPVHKIIYSCTPLFWSMVFRSKISPPFDKQDQRLIKIPVHLPHPLFKTLLYVNHYAQSGQCKLYKPSDQDSTKVKDIFLGLISS
jgi:Bacteroidetes VLRF1 release factor